MLTCEQLKSEIQKLNCEIGNYCSDLHIPVNNSTMNLISQFEFKSNVTTFTNQINGKLYCDIPFLYNEYYDKN